MGATSRLQASQTSTFVSARGPLCALALLKCAPDRDLNSETFPRPYAVPACLAGPLVLLQNIEPDGQTDDEALDDQLVERRDTQQAHAIVENADDQCANDRPADRARAACQAGAADHHRGNRVKFEHRTQIG